MTTALAGGLREVTLLVVCACGCGTPVVGESRRYVHGHNRRLDLPVPNPTGLCMCGCGRKTTVAVATRPDRSLVAGQHTRFIKGHYRPKTHRLITRDVDLRSGQCSLCGPVVIVSSQAQKTGEIRWSCRDGQRDKMLRGKYQITLDDYKVLLEQQNYRCAACQTTEHDWDRPLHVDHNHKTGAVVALLCGRCNTSAGLLDEDPIIVHRLLAYVTEKWRTA